MHPVSAQSLGFLQIGQAAVSVPKPEGSALPGGCEGTGSLAALLLIPRDMCWVSGHRSVGFGYF